MLSIESRGVVSRPETAVSQARRPTNEYGIDPKLSEECHIILYIAQSVIRKRIVWLARGLPSCARSVVHNAAYNELFIFSACELT